MSYEITITKTEIRKVESGEEWTAVGEELAIPEAVVLSDEVVDSLKLKKVYGYTPKITKSQIVTTEIYRQTMPEIDLPAVIKAVNMMD